jgi:WD40-like Beta Propeller Repeat
MYRTKIFTAVLFVLFFAAVRSFGQLPDGPYFGQMPPGMTPQVFAPGIISLPTRRETIIVFSPDGQDAFLGVAGGGGFTIQQTTQTGGHWSPLATPAFIGPGDAREPFLSPDGNRLFFVRAAHIWSTSRVNGVWTAAAALPSPVNTVGEEWHPSVSSDGTLYFGSTRGNPLGGLNTWKSPLVGGAYLTAENVGSVINFSPTALTADPWIAPDASYMLFASNVAGGFGQVDQYLSLRQTDGSWGSPKNLGAAINSSAIEYGSSVSPDGKYYFFSRPSAFSPTASGDIYWVDARAAGLPVPEPTGLPMIALGGLGAWMIVRRKRRPAKSLWQ